MNLHLSELCDLAFRNVAQQFSKLLSTNNLEKNMKSRFAQLNLNISIAITIFLLGSIALIAGASPSQKSSPPAFSPASTLPRILDGHAIRAHAYGLLDASVTTDKDDYSPGEIVQI